MLIVRRYNARLQDIAVEMHIDGSTTYCVPKLSCQISARLDERNVVRRYKIKFKWIEVALPHQNDLIQAQACTKA